MNERERFQRLFRGERVDRPPLLEEGVRDEVLVLWHSQGLPEGRTHLDVFGLTPHENIGPDLTYDGNYSGRIMKLTPREYRRAFHPSRKRFNHDSEACSLETIKSMFQYGRTFDKDFPAMFALRGISRSKRFPP